MKISGITVWRMRLPLKGPYSLSGGRLTYDAIETTFVRIDTNTGLSGWGENCPWGHTYLPAHAAGVSAALEILAPSLIGLDPRALDAINRKMDLVLPGHLYAKSAVDIACWDILGQATGLPLWMLLGGETADPVPLNSSIATGSPEEMIARIRAASAQGYRTHSAKIGSIDPILDIERIERITKSLPDGERVTFDVNRAWTPGVAVAVLTTVKTASWVEKKISRYTNDLELQTLPFATIDFIRGFLVFANSKFSLRQSNSQAI